MSQTLLTSDGKQAEEEINSHFTTLATRRKSTEISVKFVVVVHIGVANAYQHQKSKTNKNLKKKTRTTTRMKIKTCRLLSVTIVMMAFREMLRVSDNM